MRKYIITSLIGATAISASAQFNQSISVDGKYVPEIFRLDRINTFPKQVKFNLDANALNYDTKSVPASFVPMLLPLPATGWQDTRNFSDARGYLEIGAGSWLNSTLSAGYQFIDNKATTFGVRLQHNSTSLWKPEVSELMKDTKMYRYDETIGLYGSHNFDNTGKLSAAVDYHIGNFNYYGFNPLWGDFTAENAPKAPTQTLNDISARILWESPTNSGGLRWNAGAGVRYFGYRASYAPHNPYYGYDNPNEWILAKSYGSRETDININGGFNLPTASGSSFGADLNADILTYAHPERALGEFAPWQPDTYGLLTLTPYYRFSKEHLLVRLGADIDFAFLKRNLDGDNENPFGLLHVAPDVRVDYLAGPVSIYLHALGGTSLHTLASNYELDYYQNPSITSTRPVYSPLDGNLGFNFGPFSGFSAGLDMAFRITRGQYIGGWEQAALNKTSTIAGLPPSMMIDGIERTLIYSLSNDYYNLKGISIGARLAYDAGKIFNIEAKGNYQPQNGKSGYFNGYDRPRWTADIVAQTNPWNGLKFRLAYQFRGVRNIYAIACYDGALISNSRTLVGYRLPDLTYLNFGASYAFSPKFSLWLQADNLLNRHDEYLPALPTQGIRIVGGISLIF